RLRRDRFGAPPPPPPALELSTARTSGPGRSRVSGVRGVWAAIGLPSAGRAPPPPPRLNQPRPRIRVLDRPPGLERLGVAHAGDRGDVLEDHADEPVAVLGGDH